MYQKSKKKGESDEDSGSFAYLDVDEDHLDQNSKMTGLLERQRLHKQRYLI